MPIFSGSKFINLLPRSYSCYNGKYVLFHRLICIYVLWVKWIDSFGPFLFIALALDWLLLWMYSYSYLKRCRLSVEILCNQLDETWNSFKKAFKMQVGILTWSSNEEVSLIKENLFRIKSMSSLLNFANLKMNFESSSTNFLKMKKLLTGISLSLELKFFLQKLKKKITFLRWCRNDKRL